MTWPLCVTKKETKPHKRSMQCSQSRNELPTAILMILTANRAETSQADSNHLHLIRKQTTELESLRVREKNLNQK